jgi:hypothetical protein
LTILFLCGLGLIVAGMALWSPAAALVTGGLLAVAVAVFARRGSA